MSYVETVDDAAPVVLATSRLASQGRVASTATAPGVLLLAENPNRFQATVYNDSTAVLFLAFSGEVASSTAYSVQIASQGYFEILKGYVGIVFGIWAAANGFAYVTEFLRSELYE